MKSLSYLIIPILIITSCGNDSLQVVINDTNLELALVKLDLDNEVDGVLTISDQIKELEKIDLSESGIVNANILIYFKNLTKLNLGENDLTSIDLSQNKNLTELYLHSNDLTSIDLSQNKNLTNLNLSYNDLTSIDLSQNKNLTELSLFSNDLTSIDLSQNKNLTELRLFRNDLTSIDLSQNENLTNLNLSYNDLTYISLYENNSLKSVDISNNNIKNLRFIHCTALEEIYALHNPIQTVDINASFNLKYFEIPYSNSIWHKELQDICFKNNLEENAGWNWNIILLVIIAILILNATTILSETRGYISKLREDGSSAVRKRKKKRKSMTCPRCYGKGFVDLNDIKRLGMEGRWSQGYCKYCDGEGDVKKGQTKELDPLRYFS